MTDAAVLPDEPIDAASATAPEARRSVRPTPPFMLGSLVVLIAVALLAITYHTAATRDRDRAVAALDRARVEVDTARRARDGAGLDLAAERRAVAAANRELATVRAAARRTVRRGAAARAAARTTTTLSRDAVGLGRRMTDSVTSGDGSAYNRDRTTYNDRFAATESDLARAIATLQRRLALL